MTAPIVDADVRDTVSVSGLHRTLFVEAGAGTGKTTQLVTRVENLVLAHRVPLEQIAAITFTEAAAAELQNRIRVRFEQALVDTAEPDRQELCQDAIAAADMATISTLHGFASRLLGEFAIAAGLPPRVRVLDEISSQLAHEDRWSRFVDGLYDDPTNEPLLRRATMLDIGLEPRYQGQATFKDVAAELDQNWDRLSDLLLGSTTTIEAVDFGPFDAAVQAVADLPDRCSDPSDKFYERLTELIPLMSAVVATADPDRKLRLVAEVARDPWKKGRGGKKSAWDGDVNACKALVDEVSVAAGDVVSAAAEPVLRQLLHLIAREVVEAAAARRADGGLEFHDLLVLARELLRTSADARQSLHQRYTRLLLDEFQDTDPIQIELATLIAASIEGDEPGEWFDLEVDEGRIFFVGDPKQSIYRFRRADIALYLRARDRFGGGGTYLELVTNFRTVEPVLAWVNALFEHEMPHEIAGAQPRYSALSAHRSADSGVDHRPVLLGGPSSDPKISAGALRELEAADVARSLTDIRDHPDSWPILDEHDRVWRPARLSDVTILVPARTSVPYLRTALAGADIPYRLATGTLVYDTQEVRDVLAILRAIDDPTDELSLVAALRSPLHACSDVDLFTYREAGGRWNLRVDAPESVPADHPVRVALGQMRQLWNDRWWLSPSVLLDRVLNERQAFLLAFGDPRPKDVWQRLRFLVDQARAFEEAGGGSLRAFLEWASLQGADGARVHEPLLPETDDDAVRIMTIHGSKGLEFPITVLSGLTTKSSQMRRGVSVLWGPSGPPEVALRKGLATADHEPRADIEVAMDSHEKLRLLYVAATRARDHLIVSCHHKAGTMDPSATYAGRIWTYFASQPDLWRLLSTENPATELSAESRESAQSVEDHSARSEIESAHAGEVQVQRSEWIDRRHALLAPQGRPRVISATGIAREFLATAPAGGLGLGGGDGGPGDSIFQNDDDDDRSDQPDEAIVPTRRRGRTGSAIGTAVHGTLQVLDLNDPQEIEMQVRRQCDLEAIPDHAQTVAALVRSALASDAVELAATHKHYKELFVSAPFGDRVIEGYIDLLVETPEGLVVVDYKTDSVSTDSDVDAKLATYEMQGAAYAAALEASTGLPVIDCRFVFCGRTGAIERSVNDLTAAMERVRAATSV